MNTVMDFYNELPYSFDHKEAYKDGISIYNLDPDLIKFATTLKQLEKHYNFKVYVCYDNTGKINASIENIVRLHN